MTSDHSKGYQLSFTSSKSRPLCYMAGKALSLGQFRSDIEQLSSQFREDGDILICCTGRYAFSVALLASWLQGKSVVLPANHLHKTLQNIRNHHNIAFQCDADWARQLSTHQHPVAHGSWEPTLQDQEDAVQLFTSGSTGVPKAVNKSIANLLDEAGFINNNKILRFQVVQNKVGEIEFKAEVKKELSSADLIKLKDALMPFFGIVDISQHDFLDPGPSGKFRYIISRL